MGSSTCCPGACSNRARSKPSASVRRGNGRWAALQAVANAETMKDVNLATKIFDPFASFPEFLDDGSFEKRLLWEASKPGQLQALIDMNKNNPTSQNFFLQKVKELGLEKALGPHG